MPGDDLMDQSLSYQRVYATSLFALLKLPQVGNYHQAILIRITEETADVGNANVKDRV